MGIFPVRYNSFNGSDMSGMASPAQGAMFAPLVLKVPVQNIHFNTTTTTPTKSHSTAKTRDIVLGAVALLLVVAILSFTLRYRRKRSLRVIAMPPSPVASIRSVSGIGLTPFTQTHSDGTNGGQVHGMNPQQPGFAAPEALTANAAIDNRSSSPTPVPNTRSPKMALRMGTKTSRSLTTVASPVSDEGGSRASSPAVATTEQSEVPSSTELRTLQEQYEQLWCEVQDLRAGRLDVEAPPSYVPPSYVEGDVTSSGTQSSG